MKPKQTVFNTRFLLVFFVLFVISFEFPYIFLPQPYAVFGGVFESLVSFSAKTIFRLEGFVVNSISSDSVELYINLFNISIISVFVSISWNFIQHQKRDFFDYWVFTIINYYLALQLFAYGFSKVFKTQFYSPEPNILYTPIGELTHDMVYWSSIGSSWWYSFLIGISEVLLAGLLLFRKTRLIGLILGVFVMIQILIINVSFDISVKLYSAFLLAMFIVLLVPYFNYLYIVLVQKKQIEFHEEVPIRKKGYYLLKFLVVCLILTESLFFFTKEGSYNDDSIPRPPYHGAYEVDVFLLNGDTLVAEKSNLLRWERVFVHRRGYFIIQNMNDKMQDYAMSIDSVSHVLQLERYDKNIFHDLRYTSKSNKLESISGTIEGSHIEAKLTWIDIEALPLLNPEFNWTTNH